MEASGFRLVTKTSEPFLGIILVLGLISCSVQSEVGAVFDTGGGSSKSGGGNSSAAAAGTGGVGTTTNGTGLITTPRGSPIYTRAQRLTSSQFARAAVDILGLPATTDLQSGLVSPVLGTTDFSNNEHLLVADVTSVKAFEAAAEKAAELATTSAAALSRLYAGTDPAGFVQHLGRRAFRRPLTPDELARYTDLFARGEELYGAGFANGAALVIRGMLQSPSFLYRTELGPLGEPLSGYEIASKLSFWLLDTTPSDALLDDAAAGKLDDAEGLLAAASAMLEEPAAAAVMRRFHRELYQLDRLDSVFKVGIPSWSDALNSEAKEASLLFFDGIFNQGLGVRDILTSTRGFMGPKLAPLYGQRAPAQLEERELGAQRKGFFAQVPPLFLAGHNGAPASIQRGVSMALKVLCIELMAPPPEIPPLPEDQPGQTNREQLTAWMGGCGSACHDVAISPLGFAFEGFDGMGVARDTDQGKAVDASGSFSFSSGQDTFSDAAELMTKLAEDDMPYACYGRKLASYGLQRDIVESDGALIAKLTEGTRAGAIKDAVLALVVDASFRTRQKGSP